MDGVRSTPVGMVTGVVMLAELLYWSVSATFETDAEAVSSPPGEAPNGPLTVIAGSEPPAGTGSGLVQVAEEMSQLHPVPAAEVGEYG
jgi:hypothetical protein